MLLHGLELKSTQKKQLQRTHIQVTKHKGSLEASLASATIRDVLSKVHSHSSSSKCPTEKERQIYLDKWLSNGFEILIRRLVLAPILAYSIMSQGSCWPATHQLLPLAIFLANRSMTLSIPSLTAVEPLVRQRKIIPSLILNAWPSLKASEPVIPTSLCTQSS